LETLFLSSNFGMPLASERFAETIFARVGIGHNSGRRGRSLQESMGMTAPFIGQQNF